MEKKGKGAAVLQSMAGKRSEEERRLKNQRGSPGRRIYALIPD